MTISSPRVRHRAHHSLSSLSPIDTNLSNDDSLSPSPSPIHQHRTTTTTSIHTISPMAPSPSPSNHNSNNTPRLSRRTSPRHLQQQQRMHWKKLFRSRKWSATSLIVMILLLSSLCSMFVSTFSLWWWTSADWLPSTMSSSSDGMAVTASFLRGNGALHHRFTTLHETGQQRRVFYLEGVWVVPAPTITHRDKNSSAEIVIPHTDGTMMHSLRVQEDDEDRHDNWQPIDYKTSRCQPLAAWQTQSFPNCNVLHEISLHAATATANDGVERLSVLGQGWFRTTWRLDREGFADSTDSSSSSSSSANNNTADNTDTSTTMTIESTVLKTLRIEREYKREYYELHRRDAVAMERLTSSPFVVNVYGACGNSAINELADFPFPGVQSLEVFNRRLRGRDSPEIYQMKLRLATSLAVGVADIHGIDWETLGKRPTMVHYDLNPRNVALFRGGRPKLNDFNIAEFLHYDPVTNETCGFPSRLHEPWWRAPEEMHVNAEPAVLVDEKVDIYALGNILFHTLTTHSPRGKMKKERMEQVRSIVVQGIPPVFPPPYDTSTDPAAVVIRQAIEMCFEKDPKKRATAQDVADLLMDALVEQSGRGDVSAQQNWSPKQQAQAVDTDDDEEDSGSSIEAKGRKL